MRILFVTTYFEPDGGAAAVRLSRLARILYQRGHEITVLTTLPHYPRGHIDEAYRRKLYHVEDRGGIRVIRAWLWATPNPRISRKLISQNTFMLSAFLRGLPIKRPDVMLIEAQPVFTSFAGVLLSKIRRVPYVLNVSDLWPDHLLSVRALSEKHPAYRTARYLVDASYRGAAAVVSLSPSWAEKIAGYIHENNKASSKIQVIYNGVDLDRFRPDLDTTQFRQAHGLSTEKRVSFIGTFATQYDFDAMFEVIRRLSDRSDTEFLFIGSGSQAEKVTGSPLPNVKLIPWVDHNTIPQAWAASTLTYWAMRDEALYRGTIPAKLYEALACGVPIAAAMEGAGADMLNASGGGLSVPCGDIEGLTDAITRLLDHPHLLKQHSQSGRAYAEANFDPVKVAERYEAVLQGAR